MLTLIINAAIYCCCFGFPTFKNAPPPKYLSLASFTFFCLSSGLISSIPCTGVNAREDDKPEVAPEEPRNWCLLGALAEH